ncbi:hypothetical protein [Aneurinibacillus aneurinilyticus]|nr:hypothetical protein [Aneurinibacillus aneurinilyticus]MED0705458.1 hypothetical protein [Aneurinibacillus aneurinilyticus]MED0721884.1 hypothetical protein [Aneurinibacillus aneurinilyticus]MED0731526.1 hypothetical protein [Aneurinibacillus aneurinilyticus]MED0743058.1 hypothetical protein [Aneurinibacillus aneurinilyticus]
MTNLTKILQKQKTLEMEIKKYRRLLEQRFELLQLREELQIKPDAEDIKFLKSLNESIANIEQRITATKRTLSIRRTSKR